MKLGRPLERTEVVDHIDGCTFHNDPSNLRVFASNADHLKATITGKVPNWTDSGRLKFQMARWNPTEAADKFPEPIHTYSSRLKSGELVKQKILRARELLGTQSIWFLGMRHQFEKNGIAWPFDQKKERDLCAEYLQMILAHPLLKLWIEN